MPDQDDTLTTAEPDTGATQTSEPGNTDAAAIATPPAGDAGQGDSTATAAPSTKTGDTGSLAPPNSSTNPNPATAPPTDWQKRYSDLQSHVDKQAHSWKQRMESQGHEMAGLQKWKQEQEQRAKSAALKPWSKEHPEHRKFSGLLERAKTIDSQLRALPQTDAQGQPIPPQHRQAMQDAIMAGMRPEEQQQVQEYRQWRDDFLHNFSADPQGTLLPMVEQLAEQKVQQVMQRMQAASSVQQDFQDPTLKPMLEANREEFAKALQDGVPYDYSVHMMKMHNELQQSRAELAKLKGVAGSAEERTRLLKSGATQTRDPRPSGKDPYALAKAEAQKRGISPASPAFAAILQKHTE